GQRGRSDRRRSSVGRRCVVRGGRRTRFEERQKGRALSGQRPEGREVLAVRVGERMPTATTERAIFGRRDPDARGYFGEYGGRFVPETLVAPIEELTAAYLAARSEAEFQDELAHLLRH